MRPQRLTTVRRCKVSDDVLAEILAYLDPHTLWRTCLAFRRIYDIVLEYPPLRYTYELVVSGLRDDEGRISRAVVPTYARLELLHAFVHEWRTLAWAHEMPFHLPHVPVMLPNGQQASGVRVGASGGYIHYIVPPAGQGFSTLELVELPSGRTNCTPSRARRIRFETAPIEDVALDRTQSLLVASHIFSYNGQAAIQVHVRDMSSYGQHPHARAPSYECAAKVAAAAVARVSVTICGPQTVASLEFVGGKRKHLLLNWKTFEACWLADLDVLFVGTNLLLTISKKSGSSHAVDKTSLRLYDVSHISRIVAVREYELPKEWSSMMSMGISFCPNAAPPSDLLHPHALFSAAQANRIVGILARSAGGSASWVFVEEAFFLHPSAREKHKVSWKHWSHACTVKNISGSTSPVMFGPQLVGNRVLWMVAAKAGPRLHAVEFTQIPVASRAVEGPKGWTWVGEQAQLASTAETHRYIPPDTLQGYGIEQFVATEDNVVLFLNARGGSRMVNVLTFGVPRRKSRN